eukprot:CAMPEP_0204351952 /NCGR_PEP_ID=MMETSP0469-20131031/31511_1 /ASSEMBLY_ACC=CAM_ASM_000384 /TAXON_ID=2969 /ORGANISM="Oxyrrhis marina" /LENGTH=99 /DNA_ID=CAMNT_0051338603 /DNA_START=75 /DNA_END=370 /DNA_ORIENTATION=+
MRVSAALISVCVAGVPEGSCDASPVAKQGACLLQLRGFKGEITILDAADKVAAERAAASGWGQQEAVLGAAASAIQVEEAAAPSQNTTAPEQAGPAGAG